MAEQAKKPNKQTDELRDEDLNAAAGGHVSKVEEFSVKQAVKRTTAPETDELRSN